METPALNDGLGLRLVPNGPQHQTEAYLGWLRDPAVVRYSEQRHRQHTFDSCAAYAEAMRKGGHCYWAVELDDPALGHVGNVAATIDAANGVADLSIMIGEASARGCGVGRRAWGLALDWLLGAGGLRKVTGGTMAENIPMLRVMAATGMIEEGRRRRQFVLDGREVDLVMVARFRDDSL